MLKFSVLLFATLYLVILVAGLVLWAAATATGVRGNVEKFIGDLIASDNFHLLGGTVVRASVLGGLVLVVLGSGANVLFAVLYNLISDVVGGVIIVFEERPSRRRDGRPARRAVALEEPGAPRERTEILRPARERIRKLLAPNEVPNDAPNGAPSGVGGPDGRGLRRPDPPELLVPRGRPMQSGKPGNPVQPVPPAVAEPVEVTGPSD